MALRIEVVTEALPPGFDALRRQADAEGIRNVGALVDRWRSGEARFDGPGERLVVARLDGVLVGVGGVNACPEVAGALRVRRFYVAPSARRGGVARVLAEHLIARASGHADLLTCHAGASAAAAPFWEAMGFERAGDRFPGTRITHVAETLPRRRQN
ncbi:MAG: GNAT family N-acetyltransferase [Acidimicrobiales bacterium]